MGEREKSLQKLVQDCEKKLGKDFCLKTKGNNYVCTILGEYDQAYCKFSQGFMILDDDRGVYHRCVVVDWVNRYGGKYDVD